MSRPDGSLTPRWLGSIPSLGSLFGIGEPEHKIDSQETSALGFAVGEYVEYHSASAGTWIPAKILGHRDDALYDLDCKQGVPATKVRAATFTKPEFEVGTPVEYFSDTQGMWIAARIKMYNAMASTYDLDCKLHVPPSRIRLPADTRPPSPDPLQEEKEGSVHDPGVAEEVGGSCSSTCPAEQLQPQQDGPIQLIKVTRQGSSWHFEVCPDALKVLEASGQNQIAVCTVCGPYRTGKSYLMNLLLGRVQQGKSQFRVGSTTRACTDGLWMWGFAGAPGADSPSLLFLDCEGFGSTGSDKTRDAKLMSLCMLLSSVLMLNTKGVLSESLFNALSLVCNMAEHLEGQASKPALLWVLRDFLLELVDEGKRLTPDEYLDTALHKKPPEGVDAARSQAAREVRETLLRFFPRRHCATLCQPAIDEEQLRELPEVPFQKLRPEFQHSFQELQTKLFSLARSCPKAVEGQTLSTSQWANMLRGLVRSLNEGQAMNVSDAWTQVQHTSCADLVAELREGAAGELQKVQQGLPFPISGGRQLPISDEAFANSVKECRRAVREEFRRRAVGDDSVVSAHWKELKLQLLDDEKMLRQLNSELADAQLRKAGADWATWLSQEEPAAPTDPRSEALHHALESDLPAKPLARAAWEALGSARMARLKWDGALDAMKAQLKLAEDELASKEALAAAASKLEGEHMEQSRAMGQLHGQVQALQQQARESIEREKALKDQVILAEEALRKEQHSQSEATRQSEQRIQELQDQVDELRAEVLQLQEKKHETAASPRDARPKCVCSVM
mmetsp:Transcript_55789/g.130210  ORF Transcript_55789/g.130210 Transcript_55789/m.130210 type:complete len:790 (+) Transcript_55789:80-2449(+)